MTKKCSKCLEEKELNEFTSQERGLYGKRSICKACVSTRNRIYSKNKWENDEEFRKKRINGSIEWAKNNPERRAAIAKRRNLKAKTDHPEKIKARALVNQRVKFGRMPRASDCLCRCGKQASHYHHYLGYEFEHRYDVEALCVSCHNEEDKK